MALLDDIKVRLGIYYSESNKDLEVQQMIDGAIEYFRGGGWDIDALAPTAMAKEAIKLYCQMAQSTDPAMLVNHPVLISFIAQGRTVVPDEV